MKRWNGSHDDKLRFHREGKRALLAVAKKLKLEKSDFEIRSNLGGPAVCGEVILHTDSLYMWICGGLGADGYVIARRCKGRKDYGAGLDCPNRSVAWESIDNPDLIVNALRSFKLVQDPCMCGATNYEMVEAEDGLQRTTCCGCH